jgi:hypothetical protein
MKTIAELTLLYANARELTAVVVEYANKLWLLSPTIGSPSLISVDITRKLYPESKMELHQRVAAILDNITAVCQLALPNYPPCAVTIDQKYVGDGHDIVFNEGKYVELLEGDTRKAVGEITDRNEFKAYCGTYTPQDLETIARYLRRHRA